MKNQKRRDFIRQATRMVTGLAVSNLFAANTRQVMGNDGITVMIPMPIQIVIDDVGWWSGEDGSGRQEPYRTGINRNHVPADYRAIADLGKKLGVRPQAATILCEWDRENILRNVPTSTWMREKWDNTKWVGPWLDEAAEIIRNNQKHYELTLHGIGHEYWENKNFTRAEWADRSGKMRPLDQVKLHLDYFAKLMDQNKLGSFPASFVPTAFLHGFGPTGNHKVSLAEVIKKRGISYINTPFYNMHNAESVQYGVFGIDAGVMTIDRGEDLFNWNIIGGKPQGEISGPTCGMHWPNLLHIDPERNGEIVDGWVNFLAPYNNRLETMLAPDSQLFQKQLAHHICTETTVDGQSVTLNFSKTLSLPEKITGGPFAVKLRSKMPVQFMGKDIKILSESMISENDESIYTITVDRLPGSRNARIEYRKAV